MTVRLRNEVVYEDKFYVHHQRKHLRRTFESLSFANGISFGEHVCAHLVFGYCKRYVRVYIRVLYPKRFDIIYFYYGNRRRHLTVYAN